MKTEYYLMTDRGVRRPINEDNAYANGVTVPFPSPERVFARSGASSRGRQLYAVCDGMGGESYGEVASMTAVESLSALQEVMPERLSSTPDWQLQFDQINKSVFDACQRRTAVTGGTTLTGLALCGDQFTVMNIGDSRVYLMRGGVLRRLTSDHSPVAQMVRAGFLTEKEAARHPMRSNLTRYLGMNPEAGPIEVDVSQPEKLLPGDRFVLCSDGVWSAFSTNLLDSFTRGIPEPATLADALIDSAIPCNSTDNMTALIVDVH